MEVCILLSTCDKYSRLAELTLELIHERWKDHPPVFVCGLSTSLKGNAETLLLGEDSHDWIGITRAAVEKLFENGYKKFYLLLDDHPPLGICNHVHLNSTLPALMDKLKAAYIGLHGWDQNTMSDGEVLGMEYASLQRQADEFPWRYALHPALWDVQTILNMADGLIKTSNDISMRSIWAFERRSGAFPIPSIGNVKSYRIFGLGMLGGNYRWIRRWTRRLFYLSVNFLFLVTIKIFGLNAQEKLVNLLIHETLFFDGPYPLYWSGVMQKGSLHKNFERYLLFHKRNKELSCFQDALSSKKLE